MPVLVAIGCSSSLGSLALQRFLATAAHPIRWRIYANYRAEGKPTFPGSESCTWLPCNLESLQDVKSFAKQIRAKERAVDVLLLNAATWDTTAREVKVGGERWTREAVVNHLAQHYLVHLLADRLQASGEDGSLERARIVMTTSNLHKSVASLADLSSLLRRPSTISSTDPAAEATSTAASDLAASSASAPTRQTSGRERYSASKAAQLLSAHYWRRVFSVKEGTNAAPSADETARSSPRAVDIVAVSPGFVPSTNLSRDSNWIARLLMRYVLSWAPFAVSSDEGAGRIARCLPPYEAASNVGNSEATATADPLATLFASLPPSDILYISQSSSTPLDSAADAEGSSRYRVEGGAVGEWFKAGANWEEVQRILGSAIPTRKEMDSWDL
ncbi:hypothetical protein BMF94_3823 [Rhodotorula taiwanensis]|uniref:Uncharacterized protein n=1 Tax=Rhodotorula taiwanensis TaxID=741276 RepID=A0A2S5B8M9_9BASI|nr:hypothetical protein BMF94_3823 [Rhodotorula taiwanensis]